MLVYQKRKILTWLVNTVPLEEEKLWILNYLLTHDAILNNVHFVENVEKTDRGSVVADGLGKEPLLLLSKHKILQIRNKFFMRFG